MQRRLLVSLIAIAAAGAAHAETQQCTVIASVPITLSASGSYCLTGDLVSTATPAIGIKADNVTLDLNGHSLVGPGAGSGIYANMRRGIRVRNGTLRGFGNPVNIDDHNSPFTYSGYSSRHEVSDLRVEEAYTAISVVGQYSRIHHNTVADSAQFGIFAAGGSAAGAIEILGNQVFNTGSNSATSPVYGISVNGPGSVIQGNVVANLRGPANSAAIYTAGANTIVSGNRETDYGNANGVFCANAAKVEGNIGYGSTSGIVNGCISPTGYSNNNF